MLLHVSMLFSYNLCVILEHMNIGMSSNPHEYLEVNSEYSQINVAVPVLKLFN